MRGFSFQIGMTSAPSVYHVTILATDNYIYLGAFERRKARNLDWSNLELPIIRVKHLHRDNQASILQTKDELSESMVWKGISPVQRSFI